MVGKPRRTKDRIWKSVMENKGHIQIPKMQKYLFHNTRVLDAHLIRAANIIILCPCRLSM